MSPAALFAVVAALPLVASRLLHSLPEDTYAFPKYKVTFLSHLPVANQTAQKWLAHGLSGGEAEFLDEPYSSQRGISSTDNEEPEEPILDTSYSLEHMKLGPHDSYLCLIPKPLDPPLVNTIEPEVEVSPAHSWSLLQPLTGSCLYHRQGWFTYSYCHNSEIRQFKERTNSHPHAGYKPEEDPKWESYTLGKAPQASTDVAVRDGSIQLVHGGAGGSRYLVQTWGDGTLCDKSGKPREVQVQFHCSMAMSDTVLFVKEAKTCSYVLVINTPRLCSEPGFKSTRDVTEQGYIQCREVVSESQLAQKTASDGQEPQDFPQKLVRLQSELPPPIKDSGGPKDVGAGAGSGNPGQYDEILKKAMNILLGGKGTGSVDLGNGKLVMTDDGAVMVEIIDDVPLEDLIEEQSLGEGSPIFNQLVDVLRKAGISVDDEEEEDQKRPLDEL